MFHSAQILDNSWKAGEMAAQNRTKNRRKEAAIRACVAESSNLPGGGHN